MTSPRRRAVIPGPRSRRFLKRLHQVECPHVTFGSQDLPIFINHAKGTSVTDVDGNRYLDFTSFFGVSNLGHAHPRLAKVLRQMSQKGWHAMGDVHPHVLKLKACEALRQVLPIKDAQVYFSSSGSEAIETALKTALLYTKKPGVIAFQESYHGLGYGSMQTTYRKHFREPFLKQTSSFVRFASFMSEGEEPGRIEKELKKIRQWIRSGKSKKIGAILIEPIQGRAGLRPADVRFLKGLRKITRQAKILLIFDEIYSGFGRTGRWFAMEDSSVIPDVVCLGKGMANGFPISCCAATKKVFRAWGPSKGEARHTSTFLGNPLGCALILATIDEMKRTGILLRVKKMGKYLRAKVTGLKEEFPLLTRSVRGRGLMIGLELKKKKTASFVMRQALKEGLLILTSGPESQVVTFTPPFTVTRKEIDVAVQTVRRLLRQSL